MSNTMLHMIAATPGQQGVLNGHCQVHPLTASPPLLKYAIAPTYLSLSSLLRVQQLDGNLSPPLLPLLLDEPDSVGSTTNKLAIGPRIGSQVRTTFLQECLIAASSAWANENQAMNTERKMQNNCGPTGEPIHACTHLCTDSLPCLRLDSEEEEADPQGTLSNRRPLKMQCRDPAVRSAFPKLFGN